MVSVHPGVRPNGSVLEEGSDRLEPCVSVCKTHWFPVFQGGPFCQGTVSPTPLRFPTATNNFVKIQSLGFEHLTPGPGGLFGSDFPSRGVTGHRVNDWVNAGLPRSGN